MRSRSAVLALLVPSLLACGSDRRSNPVKEAFARAPRGPSGAAWVAFRFPATGGGDARLYRLPGLEEVTWRFEAGAAPIAQAVGFAGDDDLVYALTTTNELVALDLASGRVRVADTNVVLATLGPTGTPHVVRGDGSLATMERRTATPWSTVLPRLPTRVWGAARNRLLAMVPSDDGSRTLQLLADGQPPITQRLPAGEIAVSRWGDVAVVAADSGLVVLDPFGSTTPRFLALDPAPSFPVFTPSAHRIYVATIGAELLAIDRFDLQILHRMELPGPITALRIDANGRTLLARPAIGDSIWVVDLIDGTVVATAHGSWDAALPTVAPDGTILLRRDDDVVSFSVDSLRVVGRATDTLGDRWLLAAWDPRRSALELASDSTPKAEQPGQVIYIQVSSTSNQGWAEDLAANLRRAGMSAVVLLPTHEYEPYRVALGPYPNHDAAEAIGRKLGLPYWIFIRDTTRTDQ